MKSTTDALHQWLQALIINKNFQCARLSKGVSCDGRIEWEDVPFINFKGEQHMLPALTIFIYPNRENNKIIHKVSLIIHTPDIFCYKGGDDGGDVVDDCNVYSNIHLKDIVEFKKLCDKYFDKIRMTYFLHNTFKPKKNKEVYCKEYREFLMFKESMFGYFSNCKKLIQS